MPYWQTDLDLIPAPAADCQLFWSLEYGSRTDKDLLAKIRKTFAPAKPPEKREMLDLPALMTQYKPPYVRPAGPLDDSITFDRIDLVLERGLSRSPPAYLSIGREGSYLYKTESPPRLPGGERAGAISTGRLPLVRLKELQNLLESTEWLEAEGGAGAALHTDADRMALSVTRDAKARTLRLEGRRKAPYEALQTFFNDLILQEDLYQRLTHWPEDRQEALRTLHRAIESSLGLSGRGEVEHEFVFERYHDLFAGVLDESYTHDVDELTTAVDLMLLLKRDEHAEAIARLRHDRDRNLRTTVARALPKMFGERAVPLLAEMIESTEEARAELVQFGESAIPTIASIIETDATKSGSRSLGLIRAYLDHWKELSQPLDPAVVRAVLGNMRHEAVRNRGLNYHRELLKLAGESEPEPATAMETAENFLRHLKSADKIELERVRDNVGSMEKWLELKDSLAANSELKLDKLYVDKTSALAVSRPLQDKTGKEIRVVVFMNLARGTDWRVGPALASPVEKELYERQFLESHPKAQQNSP